MDLHNLSYPDIKYYPIVSWIELASSIDPSREVIILTVKYNDKGSASERKHSYLWNKKIKLPLCNHVHSTDTLRTWLVYKKHPDDPILCPSCKIEDRLSTYKFEERFISNSENGRTLSMDELLPQRMLLWNDLIISYVLLTYHPMGKGQKGTIEMLSFNIRENSFKWITSFTRSKKFTDEKGTLFLKLLHAEQEATTTLIEGYLKKRIKMINVPKLEKRLEVIWSDMRSFISESFDLQKNFIFYKEFLNLNSCFIEATGSVLTEPDLPNVFKFSARGLEEMTSCIIFAFEVGRILDLVILGIEFKISRSNTVE